MFLDFRKVDSIHRNTFVNYVQDSSPVNRAVDIMTAQGVSSSTAIPEVDCRTTRVDPPSMLSSIRCSLLSLCMSAGLGPDFSYSDRSMRVLQYFSASLFAFSLSEAPDTILERSKTSSATGKLHYSSECLHAICGESHTCG